MATTTGGVTTVTTPTPTQGEGSGSGPALPPALGHLCVAVAVAVWVVVRAHRPLCRRPLASCLSPLAVSLPLIGFVIITDACMGHQHVSDPRLGRRSEGYRLHCDCSDSV